MAIDVDLALERVLEEGDGWRSWRALRLSGDDPGDLVAIPYQDELGGFLGPNGQPSPGATGEGLCHLRILGLAGSGPSVIAADWLLDMRTPAGAWLDNPDQVPGDLDGSAGARVWATAAASCGLLAVGRDPGSRALMLLRGESEASGRFTGGGYPTFAAAGAYWLSEGAKTEIAEWALRWTRDQDDEAWDAWERATALTFWAAAGIPVENATVEMFLDDLLGAAAPEGFPDDLGLTVRALELSAFLT